MFHAFFVLPNTVEKYQQHIVHKYHSAVFYYKIAKNMGSLNISQGTRSQLEIIIGLLSKHVVFHLVCNLYLLHYISCNANANANA